MRKLQEEQQMRVSSFKMERHEADRRECTFWKITMTHRLGTWKIQFRWHQQAWATWPPLHHEAETQAHNLQKCVKRKKQHTEIEGEIQSPVQRPWEKREDEREVGGSIIIKWIHLQSIFQRLIQSDFWLKLLNPDHGLIFNCIFTFLVHTCCSFGLTDWKPSTWTVISSTVQWQKRVYPTATNNSSIVKN